jgi:uncharacterized protein (TIGR03067 family)
MMRSLVAMGVVVAACTALAADESRRPDKVLIQGEWIIELCEEHGKPDPKSVGDTLSISGAKARFIDKDDPCETCEFVVAVFAGEKPKQLDFKYTGKDRDDIGPGQDTMRGIYELEGDHLRICIGSGGDERPKEFKTAAENDLSLMLLRRVR